MNETGNREESLFNVTGTSVNRFWLVSPRSLSPSRSAISLPINRPNCRKVSECGGCPSSVAPVRRGTTARGGLRRVERGTGLTPLWKGAGGPKRKRCVPLTPHPPRSKTLARSPGLALGQERKARQTVGGVPSCRLTTLPAFGVRLRLATERTTRALNHPRPWTGLDAVPEAANLSP